MPRMRLGAISNDLRTLFAAGTLVGLTDGQLLERFVVCRDVAGEAAFAAILDRHGPMVLRTCRGIVRDPDDADDAFQATFLVLARKARFLRVRGTLGPWLHAVARRIAARVLSDRNRRRRHELVAAGRAPTTTGPIDYDDLGPVMHEEVGRLPEKFRVSIVLCHLEGLTHDQAASQLGWPVGTVRSRLARGRDRLRARLDERGASPAIMLLAPASALREAVVIRPSLAVATTRAAMHITTEMTAAGTGPAVLALTREALRAMMFRTLLRCAAGIVAVGLFATGATAVAFQAAGTAHEASTAVGVPRISPTQSPTTRPRSEAETIAEAFLKSGSDLFDAKDAAGLASTYTEDGQIILVGQEGGAVKEDTKQGRGQIEEFYRSFFQGQGAIDSENLLEFARRVGPDVLVAHGRFRPNRGEPEWPFVQMRVRRGDRWELSKLWLFLGPGR